MAPEPYRGKRCDSGYVYRVAETIAQVEELYHRRGGQGHHGQRQALLRH